MRYSTSRIIFQSNTKVTIALQNYTKTMRLLKPSHNLIIWSCSFFPLKWKFHIWQARIKTLTHLAISRKTLKKPFAGPSLYWHQENRLQSLSHLFLTAKLDCQDQGRSASCWPASSARWSPPWPRCGHRAAWRWGSQDRRGRPAEPSTPVSAAPLLSTWEDQKICNAKFGFKKCLKEIFFMFLAFSSPLSSA